MIYRTGAFDHFDSILCAGPHHCDETRAWEKLNNLPRKKLFEHGYAPIDILMALAEPSVRPPRGDRPLNVLLAPSWGPNGILERGAEPLVSTLLRVGYRVIVRPHPRTSEISRATITALSSSFSSDSRFVLDVNTESLQPLLDADIMISDWSGVAMEFSFGLERPVLFINGPRKVNNPRWSEIGIPPLEDIFRTEAGAVLNVECTSEAPAAIERLLNYSGIYAEHARALRAKYLFNPGNSGRSGAKHIAALAAEAHQLSRQQ
jgi:YidC/Oxa1 family membrane protein insertase